MCWGDPQGPGVGFSAIGRPLGLDEADLQNQQTAGALFDTSLRPDTLTRSDPGEGLDVGGLTRHRCSAFLEAVTSEGAEESRFYLWTALHCWKPVEAAAFELLLFDPASKQYLSAPFQTPLTQAIQGLRALASDERQVEDTVAAQDLLDDLLFSASERFSHVTEEVVGKCLLAEESFRSQKETTGLTTMCVNGLDAVRTQISFDDVEPDFLELLTSISVSQKQIRSELEESPFLTSSQKEDMFSFFFNYASLSQIYIELFASPVIDALETLEWRCTEGDQRGLCLFQQELEEAGFSTLRNSEQVHVALGALEEHLISFRPVTSHLMFSFNGLFQSRMKLSTHLRSLPPGTPTFEQVASETLGESGLQEYRHYHLGLPTATGGPILAEDTLRDHGIVVEVFSFPSHESDFLLFQRGDSGSWLLFEGLMPIGNLSTMNGIPRTGGLIAPVLPVSFVDPTSEDDFGRDDDLPFEIVSGQPTPGEDSDPDLQEESVRIPGSEAEEPVRSSAREESVPSSRLPNSEMTEASEVNCVVSGSLKP